MARRASHPTRPDRTEASKPATFTVPLSEEGVRKLNQMVERLGGGKTAILEDVIGWMADAPLSMLHFVRRQVPVELGGAYFKEIQGYVCRRMAEDGIPLDECDPPGAGEGGGGSIIDGVRHRDVPPAGK